MASQGEIGEKNGQNVAEVHSNNFLTPIKHEEIQAFGFGNEYNNYYSSTGSEHEEMDIHKSSDTHFNGNHICEECGSFFDYYQDLKRHQSKHHQKPLMGSKGILGCSFVPKRS